MEVQEKKMFELRMGSGPATTFFQELEVLATKAGRRHDVDARGLMVKATRLGVPPIIQHHHRPRARHPRRLRRMEGQDHSDVRRTTKELGLPPSRRQPSRQPPTKGTSATTTTATSHTKAGGATSSPTPKASSGQRGKRLCRKVDNIRRAGKPMDIDVTKLRAEGRCFRCHEKGTWARTARRRRITEISGRTSYQRTGDGIQGRSEGGKSSGDLGSDSPKIAKDLHTGARLSSAGRSHGLFVGTPFNPTCIKRTNISDSHTHSNIPPSPRF
ncbi:uncharacterized protein ARMOST_06099 [Armillaria ostoyae]|uniref:Retrotransposon gag domain-containing protein n=1 Tax=Armillaria ostoyae TaxID=47428 RepID=A0A284R226_ARMOS|nr:uncharacterized protein ARMOST_06099 [Armillaria ostoyae]